MCLGLRVLGRRLAAKRQEEALGGSCKALYIDCGSFYHTAECEIRMNGLSMY